MARIRTIKPEFWQNESLANVSLHAKLLAIALLNHADDEGYFLASAPLVRAACFPFDEDSKNVLGSLKELSSIGYIEVRECAGKRVGIVCKFLTHQRIDKPQKSKLKSIFIENCSDSKNVPGTLQERSKNAPAWNREQGTGKGKEQGEGEGEGSNSLSFHMRDKEFSKVWGKWRTHLAAEGKPLNVISEEEQLMRLSSHPVTEAIDIVKFSIHRQAKNLILNGDHKKANGKEKEGVAW